MTFKSGVSGNMKGRPKGIVDKRLLYKSIINAHSEELINIAIEKAKSGNDMMMKLVLERVLPAKARDNLITKDIMVGHRVAMHQNRLFYGNGLYQVMFFYFLLASANDKK